MNAMFGLALLAGSASLPPGTPIDDGVVVTVSPEGVEFLGSVAGNLFDEHRQLSTISGSVSCGGGFTLDYEVEPENEQHAIDFEFENVQVQARDGSLRVDFDGTGRGTGLGGGFTRVVGRYTLDGCSCSCGGYINVPPTVFDGFATGNMVVAGGAPRLELFGGVNVTIDTLNLQYSGCTAGLCGSVLPLAVPFLENIIEAEAALQIEEHIEDEILPVLNAALATAVTHEVVSLAGSPVAVDIDATSASITSSAGIVVSGRAAIEALAPSPCVGFAAGSAPAAAGTAVAAGTSPVRASVAGDVVSQALFAAWQAGALCRRVEEIDGVRLTIGTLALPEVQTTAAVLGLTDATALTVELRPQIAPSALLDGPTPAIRFEDLDVHFLVMLENRVVRLASVRVDATIAVELALGGETSTRLRVASLAAESIETQAPYDEFLGEEGAAAFASALDTVLVGWVPSLASPAASVELGKHGIRLRDLTITTGDGALHFDTGLAPEAGGCSAAEPGGCGVEGCQLAPRQSRSAAGGVLVILLGLGGIVARRRRLR